MIKNAFLKSVIIGCQAYVLKILLQLLEQEDQWIVLWNLKLAVRQRYQELDRDIKTSTSKKSVLNILDTFIIIHCVKSVQIRSFFWSVFSFIQTEYGDVDQKNLRIWTLFTQ